MERKIRHLRNKNVTAEFGVIEHGKLTKVITISAESLEEFRKKKEAWLKEENL